MNTKRTRLVAVLLGAIVLSAPLAMAVAPSLVFTNLRGTMHVSQDVPCGDPVEVTTTIADGRMEITPSAAPPPIDSTGGGGGAAIFDLTRMDLFMTPFTIKRQCLGFNVTAAFREIGIQLAHSVRFTGVPVGPGVFRFSIPRDQVLVYESVLDNLPVKQPETKYERPSEDVTGEINLGRHTAELHIAFSSSLRFRAGCVHNKCVIDQVFGGRQTADVTGFVVPPDRDTDHDGVPDLIDNCPMVANPRQEPVPSLVFDPPAPIRLASCAAHDIGVATATDVCRARPVVVNGNITPNFAVGENVILWRASDGIDPLVTARQIVTVTGPDHVPPTVSCIAGKPQTFTVKMTDDCRGRTTLKLGSFSLVNGETIQVEQTGKPGVRLINTTSNDQTKHFLVGKGEALIVATDASGNMARAACGAPADIPADIAKKK